MPIQPNTIAFEGIVDESMYLSLVPAMDKYIVLPLGLLIGFVMIPISILSLVFSVSMEQRLDMIVGSIILLVVMIAAFVFCVRISAVRRRTISYLTKSPDLLGRMQGVFSEKGLLLSDNEKTHWFPWLQLSKMAVSKAGVRVPLSDNPLRFLALGADLFNDFRPAEIRFMLSRNRVGSRTVEELISESAIAFDQTMESPCFYWGNVEQSVSLKKKLTSVLIGPILGIALLTRFALFSKKDRFTEIFLIAMAIYLLLPQFSNLIKLARGRYIETSQHWGWLTTHDLIFGSGGHVMKIPLSLMHCTNLNTETLNFILPSGSCLPVFRIHFRDAKCFDRMADSMKLRPSDNQNNLIVE
jgi:hypothetical protein